MMNAVLEEMAASFGEDSSIVVNELIDIFVETTPGILESIQNAVANDDYVEIQNGAHSIKSSAAKLGAVALSDLAKDLELQARAILNSETIDKEEPDCVELYERMLISYQNTAHDLQTIRLKFNTGRT